MPINQDKWSRFQKGFNKSVGTGDFDKKLEAERAAAEEAEAEKKKKASEKILAKKKVEGQT